jgi:hypothetical protein
MRASACGGGAFSFALVGGSDPLGNSEQVVWNMAMSAVLSEFGGSAAGLENGFVGGDKVGGSANGGSLALRSKKSNMLWAFASR